MYVSRISLSSQYLWKNSGKFDCLNCLKALCIKLVSEAKRQKKTDYLLNKIIVHLEGANKVYTDIKPFFYAYDFAAPSLLNLAMADGKNVSENKQTIVNRKKREKNDNGGKREFT
jgi:hypothetical protein